MCRRCLEQETGSVVTHVERIKVRTIEPLDTLQGVDSAAIHDEIFQVAAVPLVRSSSGAAVQRCSPSFELRSRKL